ncbi:sigma-70 family RNA polymerase sigma factor [Kitasatospora sp. NPDC085879]|uniref:RNA polymerase sigma factor n=1 Tax=Kitasatospora sp. NPDC085879 TaxID=3154769 RepID=UPI000BB14C2C|nr:sigma-70 family RNA polymerase sigma factor [Streptomyces sp. TLI_235]PBC69846.1 RNA polymerase sigma-70 factor (ECF subfamily) [Streptomyces sp. TLI_235]
MGDREAFRRVYREHYDAVYRYMIRRVGATDAADLAAEVFTVAWRRMDALPALAPLPWLYAVARNTVANHRRKAGRAEDMERSLAVEATATARDIGETVTERHTVHRAWAALRTSDQEVLALIGWEGLTVREAARVLGCSAPACSVRLMRARTRLAQALETADGARGTTETIGRASLGASR